MPQKAPDHIKKIIVIMGQVDEYGNLTRTAYLRIVRAVAFYRENEGYKIVCPARGIYQINEHPVTEAEKIARCVAAMGVQDEDILKEESSCDTIGGAYFIKTKIAIPNKVEDIVVITSDMYLPRTQYCFELVFGNSVNLKLISTKNYTEGSVDIDQVILSEQKKLGLMKNTWFKNISPGDHVRVWEALQQHPGYNPHSKISIPEMTKLIKDTKVDN